MTAGCCGQSREAEERDHQTADDQADAVDGIRNCNSLQTAEDRVAAADDADDNAEDCDSDEFAGAHDAGDVKNLLENNGARVEDDRQVEDGVHNDDYDREHRLGASAVALLHQRRDGHGAHFEVFRKEVVRQNQKREHRADVPGDRAHVGFPALAVQTDELFCGKVGQEQRTCDDHTGKSASCEEVAFGGVELFVTRFPCGNDGDQGGEQYKRYACPCERGEECHLDNPHIIDVLRSRERCPSKNNPLELFRRVLPCTERLVFVGICFDGYRLSRLFSVCKREKCI